MYDEVTRIKHLAEDLLQSAELRNNESMVIEESGPLADVHSERSSISCSLLERRSWPIPSTVRITRLFQFYGWQFHTLYREKGAMCQLMLQGQTRLKCSAAGTRN